MGSRMLRVRALVTWVLRNEEGGKNEEREREREKVDRIEREGVRREARKEARTNRNMPKMLKNATKKMKRTTKMTTVGLKYIM